MKPNTTLFTGAGASKAIGYPVTSDLLPLIRTGLKSGDLFDGFNDKAADGKRAKMLLGYLNQLLPGFRAAEDSDLPLITDVLSLVEHALVSGEALPVGGPDELRRFRDLLKQAIVSVLLEVHLAAWNPEDRDDTRQKGVLTVFRKWVEGRADGLGIVTTNYDIGLDGELYNKGRFSPLQQHLDLGFDWRLVENSGRIVPRPAKPSLRIFKLHGSLDLLRCSLCGHAYFNPDGSIIHQAFRDKLDEHNTCHCNGLVRLESHIVAPSLVRDIRDANILSVWRSAFEWMRNCRRWVIVGYSLPPEDLAIRSLLIRAYAVAQEKPKIVVVQRSKDQEARYRVLFPDCDYRSDGLDAFLQSEK